MTRRLFSGYFMTTDGRKWSVVFSALSWSDARSMADPFGATVEGVLVATYDEATGEEVPSVACFAAWTFDGDGFKEGR